MITIVDSPDSEDIGNNTFENDVDFDDGYHVDNAQLTMTFPMTFLKVS